MFPTKEEMYTALEKRHGTILQQKLQNASVAVCGLGGLGSNIAVHLARAGVGRIHLIDFDKVDISNLNRQQYDVTQIGQYKSDALSEKLRLIAPYSEITAQNIRLTEDNISDILYPFEFICEAFDKADQKAMLVNCVLEKLPGHYIVSGNGMAGLGSSNEIKTQRVSDYFYICGDQKSDINEGQTLFSARVAICAAHQANMVIRIISGLYDA